MKQAIAERCNVEFAFHHILYIITAFDDAVTRRLHAVEHAIIPAN